MIAYKVIRRLPSVISLCAAAVNRVRSLETLIKKLEVSINTKHEILCTFKIHLPRFYCAVHVFTGVNNRCINMIPCLKLIDLQCRHNFDICFSEFVSIRKRIH